jgi:hypothetical protein
MGPSFSRALTAAALLSLASGGCASIVGDQDTETKFLVKPGSSGSFFGWSEITIQDDTSSVNSATLDFVTLSRLDDTETGDLTFIQSVDGSAGPDATHTTLIAKKDGMPKGEQSVPLDIVYTDNLKPLFPDGHTIHINWNGVANTAGLPAEGVWIQVKVRVHIE